MEHKVLEILNLDIGYSKPLVSNINATLNQGEFIVLLGSNGAGKSTFLKTLTKKVTKLEGQIKLDNNKLSNYSNQQLSQKIAIVSTNQQFDLNLTVSDILALGRIPYLNLLGKLMSKDIAVINKHTNSLDIADLLKKYFYQLSDGQKQKVLIARALIQETPIIILDEPTAHLDIKNRFFIFELLNKIAVKEQKSIICATHEIDIALKYSTKAWLIDKNRNLLTIDPKNTNTDKVYTMLF